METLIVTTKVSADGTVTLPVPANVAGRDVEIRYTVKPKTTGEAVDKYGWPIGFWEQLAADPITDPAFRRYPQPEADPPPSFE
jgi:hypothetical protein